MSTAERFIPNYTVADYQSWDGDWELWNGVAIAMPSPFGPHQSLAPKLAAELLVGLRNSGCNRYSLLQEIDWIVNDSTVVRPDMVVVADGVPEKHVQSVPVMAVEILSASTEEKDRCQKFDLYQTQGVAWYLLADPMRKQLSVFRLDDGHFQSLPGATKFNIELSPTCTLEIDAARVFS